MKAYRIKNISIIISVSILMQFVLPLVSSARTYNCADNTMVDYEEEDVWIPLQQQPDNSAIKYSSRVRESAVVIGNSLEITYLKTRKIPVIYGKFKLYKATCPEGVSIWFPNDDDTDALATETRFEDDDKREIETVEGTESEVQTDVGDEPELSGEFDKSEFLGTVVDAGTVIFWVYMVVSFFIPS